MDLKKRFWIPLVCVSSVALCTQSCVNEAYDLRKGIDTSIDINGDISAPIGSTQKIKIGDFLKIDDSTEGISKNSDGDYQLDISGSTIKTEIDAPELTLSDINIGNSDNPGGFGITMQVPAIPGISGLEVPEYTYTFQPEGSSDTEITINESVPDYITAIDFVNLASSAEISLLLSRNDNSDKGELTIAKGFRLVFPEFLTLAKTGSESFYSLVGPNTVEFTSDVVLTAGQERVISLSINSIDFKKMPQGQGLVDGRIVIDDKITMTNLVMTAEARSFASQIADLPSSLRLAIDMRISDIIIRDITLKMNPSFDIEDQTVDIGEMPEFIEGANVTIDIYNPVISLKVNNQSPLPVTFRADILAYVGDEQTASVSLGNADETADDAIVLEPGITDIYISRKVYEPETSEGNVISIIKDDLSSLMARIPEKIVVADIKAGIEDTFHTIELSGTDKYVFSADYSIVAPMAFGKDLLIEYPYDITGLNKTLNPDSGNEGSSSFQIHFREASVYLTFVNEIPLRMAVTASPIDAEGNVINEGIEVSLVDPDSGEPVSVAPGKTDVPQSTEAVIMVKADLEAVKVLDGFRLNIKGTCDSEYEGIALNENQGISLKDISVNIQGGVTTQF